MKTVKNLLMVALTFAISIPCLGEPVDLKKRKSRWGRSLGIELVTTIQADYSEIRKALTIDFCENAGSVIVSVRNSQGNVIYSRVVNADKGTSLFVPLQNFSAGAYHLSITPMGEVAIEGSFYIY